VGKKSPKKSWAEKNLDASTLERMRAATTDIRNAHSFLMSARESLELIRNEPLFAERTPAGEWLDNALEALDMSVSRADDAVTDFGAVDTSTTPPWEPI
jgi:hypothetical protein